jgi:hypothetical protein
VTTRYPLADAIKIKTMLGFLFDGLDVKPGKKLDLLGATWVGLYVADDGKPVAACVVDSSLAAYSSAALSMLPPNLAKEAIKSGDLSVPMLANLYEIMNICSRLLMSDSSPHLKLDTVSCHRTPDPAAKPLLGAAKGRADFEISLPKYGSGSLALISS